MLARKKIRCNWRLKREDAIEEVAHLQRLSHAHIVRGVGTYVMGKDLSILLYPATEHNLESFLDEYMELSPERSDKNALLPEEHGIFYQMKTDMNKFPRCLVQAIAFVHERLVKHMDIKPTNLLVQKKIISGASSYQIYLADFGIARSYDTAADAETESRTPFSRTYAAPEVIRQEVRGFPADIFSLGCVVLEIYVALTNKRVELVELRHGNLNGDVSYQANLDAIIDQSRWLSNGYRERYGELYRDISIYETVQKSLEMMHRLPGDRPTAQALASYDAFKPASCCYGGPELFEAEPASKRNQSYLEVVQE
jgi:serine/threonine protein kinase